MNKQRTLFARITVTGFGMVNRFVPWHRLRKYIGVLNLYAFREVLREENLHNTRRPGLPSSTGDEGIAENANAVQAEPFDPKYLYRRHAEGHYNDLADPLMGAAKTRFGRNVPLDAVKKALQQPIDHPSPRVVSNELLARKDFIAAEQLNLLAAAWIQFMTHDWFHHSAPSIPKGPADVIAFNADDDWKPKDGTPPGKMWVRRTPADPTQNPGDGPPTFLNDGSHWWDGSQIYGNDEKEADELRCADCTVEWRGPKCEVWEHDPNRPDAVKTVRDTRGELRLVGHRMDLPSNHGTRQAQVGLFDNWWVGLALMHTVFAQEHNAIAARLRLAYPHWDSDRIFHTARLINVALIAKIHTVEWTPAILNHPTLDVAMNANWSGVVTEKITNIFGRLGNSEEVSGIPGSTTEQHGAPYSLTEEFASVYRLHPLLPDEIQFRKAATGETVVTQSMEGLIGDKVSRFLRDQKLELDDVCYSFGIANPGAPVLHNFPEFLRKLSRPDMDANNQPINNRIIDLAAIDVTRDRERGVPRYNDFRELIHRGRISTYEEITGEPSDDNPRARALRKVYGQAAGKDQVDLVDLMPGMYAETFPEGFGFSDTAFRVFILMASRRLKSDRFFTTDFTEDVYTSVGMDWIQKNDMSSVLIRHFPAVAAPLRQVKNAFAPWPKMSAQPMANDGKANGSAPSSVASLFATLACLVVTAIVVAGALIIAKYHPSIENVWAIESGYAVMIPLGAAAVCYFFRRYSALLTPMWRAFWTGAFIALLIHIWIGVADSLQGKITEVFHTPLVSHPIFDTLLAIWWAIDVVLAWKKSPDQDTALVRFERTVANILFPVAFVWATFEGKSLTNAKTLTDKKTLFVGHATAIVMLAVVAIAVACWISIRKPVKKA